MVPHPRRRLFLALWLLGISGIAASLAWSLWPVNYREGPAGDPFAVGPGGKPTPPPFEMELANPVPGTRTPPARPAAGAALADDQMVVGVTAGGHSRAYALKAMSFSAPSHVINDVLGGVPVSVTFCDRYHCTRVFTGDTPGEPLELGVDGVKQGGLDPEGGGTLLSPGLGRAAEAGRPALPVPPPRG